MGQRSNFGRQLLTLWFIHDEILWAFPQISKTRSPKNTYGFVRAEVLGALVNSVFLLALCFAIVVEAIQRLTTGEISVSDPDTLLYVGIVGLVFNLVALTLLHVRNNGSSKSSPARVVHSLSGHRDVELDDSE